MFYFYTLTYKHTRTVKYFFFNITFTRPFLPSSSFMHENYIQSKYKNKHDKTFSATKSTRITRNAVCVCVRESGVGIWVSGYAHIHSYLFSSKLHCCQVSHVLIHLTPPHSVAVRYSLCSFTSLFCCYCCCSFLYVINIYLISCIF